MNNFFFLKFNYNSLKFAIQFRKFLFRTTKIFKNATMETIKETLFSGTKDTFLV